MSPSFNPLSKLHTPAAAVLLLTLWLTLAGNAPLWQRIAAMGLPAAARWGAALSLAALAAALMAGLLTLLAWPRVLRPLASVLVLVTAITSYFMSQYGVVIDSTMLVNALHTDARETADLLSPRLLLTVGLVAGPPLWWLWRRPLVFARPRLQAQRNALGLLTALLLAVAALLAGYQNLASLMRNDKPLRYMVSPLNSVYASAKVLAAQLPKQARTLQPVGLDAHLVVPAAVSRPPLLVLVVGETARAQNWGLNGYERATTPALARWQARGGLVNFGHVRACGTNTQVSVPCLFSPLTREQGGDEKPEHENLLDVLQRAGLAVLWLDNQSGCKGVCDRVPNVNTRYLGTAPHCADGECHDEVMLQDLDARIAALDPQRRARGVVLVMHQMGSHGPAYFRRAPAAHKRFLPECASNTLAECPPEQLRNAYDNTLLYTDHFLNRTLQWLNAPATTTRYDTGLLYVSDHGESLGEGGLYLHGLPYALAPVQQTQVPMVAWLSPGFQRRSAASTECLRAQAQQPLSHDYFFHSVLGLMGVQTTARNPALDLTTACAQPARGVLVAQHAGL